MVDLMVLWSAEKTAAEISATVERQEGWMFSPRWIGLGVRLPRRLTRGHLTRRPVVEMVEYLGLNEVALSVGERVA